METNKAELLDEAVTALNRLIELTRGCGMQESALFLAMAKTQLLIERNGIADVEFRALCAWLEGKQPPPGDRRGQPSRVRRDGHLKAMDRAWQCPQDVPTGRGGRRRANSNRS
jgi:hypothetical protein